MTDGLLDTSVLVPIDGEGLADRPGTFAISVLSIAELHKGIAGARGTRQRAGRVARLALIEQLFEALPVDRRVAVKYGEIAARTRRLAQPPHVIDGLIAATAIVHGVPVITRDRDFDRIPGVRVVRV